MNERMRRQVKNLVLTLEGGKVEFARLGHATHVPGWIVQRCRQEVHVYKIWRPDERPSDVPWAIPPAPRTLRRGEAVEYLREHWLPDAKAYLKQGDDNEG